MYTSYNIEDKVYIVAAIIVNNNNNEIKEVKGCTNIYRVRNNIGGREGDRGSNLRKEEGEEKKIREQKNKISKRKKHVISNDDDGYCDGYRSLRIFAIFWGVFYRSRARNSSLCPCGPCCVAD